MKVWMIAALLIAAWVGYRLYKGEPIIPTPSGATA